MINTKEMEELYIHAGSTNHHHIFVHKISDEDRWSLDIDQQIINTMIHDERLDIDERVIIFSIHKNKSLSVLVSSHVSDHNHIKYPESSLLKIFQRVTIALTKRQYLFYIYNYIPKTFTIYEGELTPEASSFSASYVNSINESITMKPRH